MPSLQIIPPRVPLTDPRTGEISREWYRFLFDQFMAVVTTATALEGGLRVIPGLDGNDGEDGERGVPGQQGQQGIPGGSIPGLDGDQGEDGERGVPGPMGAQGVAGVGIPGLDGQDGEDSGMCPPGSSGNSTWNTVGQITKYMDFSAQGANPPAPPAGTARFHAFTTQGFTRFEQDNEATTNLILGRDTAFIAKNTSGGAISKGQPVYVTGSTGNVPNIGLARANSLTTLPAVGVALDDIANNAFGQVMHNGVLSSIDTSAYSTGATLWVSTSAAGAFQTTRATSPNLVQRIGTVLVSGVGNGSILIVTAPFIGGMETGNTTGAFGSAAYTASTAYAPAAGSSSVVTVGALNAGSIASGFGSIDIGSDPITAGDVNFNNLYSRLNLSQISSGSGSFPLRFGINGVEVGRFETTGSLSALNGFSVTGDADVSGLYKAGGTSGVASFGPAAVASITVKNGIVTAIS